MKKNKMPKINQNFFRIGCVSVSFVLFCFLNNYDSLWWDEICSMMATDLSFKEMLPMLVLDDAHPPLYYILLKIWRTVFGSSVFAARSLSWTGIALLAFIGGRKVEKLYGKNTAIWFVLMVLFFPIAFPLQRMVRMYALCFCLIGLQLLYCLSFLKEGKKAQLWKGVLFSLMACFLHYYGMFAAGIIYICTFVAALCDSDRRSLIASMIPAGIVVIVGLIPDLMIMRTQFLKLAATDVYQGIDPIFALKVFWQGYEKNTDILLLPFLQQELLTCGWIFMLLFFCEKEKKPVFVKQSIYISFGVVFLFCYSLFLFSVFYRPVFVARQSLLIFAPVFLIFALSVVRDRKYEILFGSLFSLVFVLSINDNLALKRDTFLTDLRQEIAKTLAPGDIVITDTFENRIFMQYYFPKNEVYLSKRSKKSDAVFMTSKIKKLDFDEYRQLGGKEKVYGLTRFPFYSPIFGGNDVYGKSFYHFYRYPDE